MQDRYRSNTKRHTPEGARHQALFPLEITGPSMERDKKPTRNCEGERIRPQTRYQENTKSKQTTPRRDQRKANHTHTGIRTRRTPTMATATRNIQCHWHNYPWQLTDCLPSSARGPVSSLPKIRGLVRAPLERDAPRRRGSERDREPEADGGKNTEAASPRASRSGIDTQREERSHTPPVVWRSRSPLI